MPQNKSHIRFIATTLAKYSALSTKNANGIYFCTDTRQLFVGSKEYTKSTVVLDAQPTQDTQGDHGRLYFYNGMMFLCEHTDDAEIYKWTKVANVNNAFGTVKSITAGDGLDTSADSDNPITTTGTIVHKIPEGAQAITSELEDVELKYGDEFTIQSVDTDKFGHVIKVNVHKIKMPANPIPQGVSIAYDANTDTVTFS